MIIIKQPCLEIGQKRDSLNLSKFKTWLLMTTQMKVG